jgi:hypothetical protein
MSKRDTATLPPPTTHILLQELAQRWRRSPITTRRLARKFGLNVYRLTSRDHLYSLAEIEEVERASQIVLPKPPGKNWDKLLIAKAAKARKEVGAK